METENIPKSKIAERIDRFVVATGNLAAWFNVLLIGVIILQVVLRYVFGMGMVQLEEMQWHLFAVNVIFGLAYCQSVDSHIRLDLLHIRMTQRQREWVELFGILFLSLPLIYVIFVHSIDFVWEALRTMERSDSPMGLPYRWIPKSLIPISMVFFFLAALARLIQAVHYLRHSKKRG